jgi:hypothetical protein
MISPLSENINGFCAKRQDFLFKAGVAGLVCDFLVGQSPLSVPGRAVRHGDLDGSVPDLVRISGVSNSPLFLRDKAMPLNHLESVNRGAATGRT